MFPIEYNNTLDVYFFKSNPSIMSHLCSSGLEINVLESGIYSNSSATNRSFERGTMVLMLISLYNQLT